MNLKILESKLRRHKISYSKNNEEIIIGQAKKDILTYIVIGILPLAFVIWSVLYLIIYTNKFRLEMLHLLVALIFLIGIGSFNLIKHHRKKNANRATKVFLKDKIIIKTPTKEHLLNSNTIKEIRVSNIPLDKENYEGNLFIVDTENKIHHILGFHDKNERYVSDDLQWFSDFILTQIRIKKPPRFEINNFE